MKTKIIRLTAIAICASGIMACNSKNNDQSQVSETTMTTETTEEPTNSPSNTSVGFVVTGKDTLSVASGLKYILVEEGKGAKPTVGKRVSVHYTGYLTDGTKFDSSIDRGQPYSFPLGTGQVIKGWDEGIALLNQGSKARLIIPAEMGYGADGYPPLIPSNATLIFDVELVSAE